MTILDRAVHYDTVPVSFVTSKGELRGCYHGQAVSVLSVVVPDFCTAVSLLSLPGSTFICHPSIVDSGHVMVTGRRVFG